MNIKMKALAAGPNGVLLEGQTYSSPNELSDEQAQALVDGGYAVEIQSKFIVEAADPKDEILETADAPVEPIEKAVKPRVKKK